MMNLLPSNSAPFIGATSDQIVSGQAAILGCGYDGTTSFRPGTRRGPDGLRAVSDAGIETYSPTQDRDLEDIRFSDLGNLDIPYGAPEPVVELLYQATREIFEGGAIPAIIGGEHSISPGPIRAAFEAYPDLVVIQFDAHADLREEWNGTSNSHACAMRRVLDFLPSERLLQLGIRSGTREEFVEMRKESRLVAPDADALAAALETKGLSGAPIYVTFDLDIFDPSLVCGTGTPEPGGISWQTFEEIREVLEGETIIGFDIVELAPTLDPGETSSVVAAKLMREFLLMLG
ncbi:MAG: agmatinase [Verrucomicrobiaceae bacterium]